MLGVIGTLASELCNFNIREMEKKKRKSQKEKELIRNFKIMLASDIAISILMFALAFEMF